MSGLRQWEYQDNRTSSRSDRSSRFLGRSLEQESCVGHMLPVDNTKYQRSRRSLVDISMPRERQRQDRKTHKAIEILRSGVLMILWIRLSFWVTSPRDSEAQKTMKIPRVQHVDKIVNFPVLSQHQSTRLGRVLSQTLSRKVVLATLHWLRSQNVPRHFSPEGHEV